MIYLGITPIAKFFFGVSKPFIFIAQTPLPLTVALMPNRRPYAKQNICDSPFSDENILYFPYRWNNRNVFYFKILYINALKF